MKHKLFLLFVFSFLTAALATPASAAVIISELYPAPPTGSGQPEWIELANTSDEDIDISDWEVWDQLASPGHLHTFPAETSFPAKSFLLIELQIHKLNNGGDGVILIDAEGNTTDEFWYSSSEHGKSWQRLSAVSGDIVISEPTPEAEHPIHTVLSEPEPTPTPTPTPSPTHTPSPTPTLDPALIEQHVTLTEFMACPSGGGEWIELYNTGPHMTITDWLVRNSSGSQRRISGELPPFTYTQFTWNGAVLRNAGDEFSVYTDSGQEIGAAQYDNCTLGLSHVWDGNSWIQLPLDLETTLEKTGTTITAEKTEKAGEKTTEPEEENPATNPAVLGKTTTTSTPFPLPLPKYTPSELQTGAATTEQVIEFDQPELPKLPVLSVIMGGLLQLLPGAITLYAKRSQPSDLS